MNSNKDMVSISGLSVRSANIRRATHDETGLSEALAAHVKCKIRLRDYIDCKVVDCQPELASISRHEECMLGEWILGPGRAITGGDAQFDQLYADHAQLHMLAAEMIRRVQANEHVAARELFDGEFQKISHRVKQAVVKLSQDMEA